MGEAPAGSAPAMAPTETTREFPFAVDLLYSVAARAFLIDAGEARATIDREGDLTIRFGPWTLHTPVENVATAEVTGPYAALKTLGPPHVSLHDRGITFATNAREGVCISFIEPVGALEPLHLLKHPSATVTVAAPDLLVAALTEARAAVLEPQQQREELADADRLRAMTASELRHLASELGLTHRSSRTKAQLVDLLLEHFGARVGEVVPDEDRRAS